MPPSLPVTASPSIPFLFANLLTREYCFPNCHVEEEQLANLSPAPPLPVL